MVVTIITTIIPTINNHYNHHESHYYKRCRCSHCGYHEDIIWKSNAAMDCPQFIDDLPAKFDDTEGNHKGYTHI